MASRRGSHTEIRRAALVVAALTGASALIAPTPAHSAAVNDAPIVVPELQAWAGGEGDTRLTESSRIVADAESAEVAARLADDLGDVTGLHLDVVTSDARAGDIVLDVQHELDHAAGGERFDEEGYVLTIGDTVQIAAPTDTGVFYGTRSALQILAEADDRATLPRGEAIDWPDYAERGFMLDVGRRFFTADFVRDYIAMMSWYKLNTFQIHLNDNQIPRPADGWQNGYAGFRLASDNPDFAGLASEDGAYDRADWQSFEDTAADHHLTIVPEIDVPAHSLAFIQWKPELGLHGGDSDHLDLTKPATTEVIKSVFNEFMPWFEGPDVHFGADEYPREYATQYVQFFNDMAAHVRSHGKQPRAWGSASVMTGNADGYDRDVIINNWNDGWYGMASALKDGYRFINTNDATLYVVPFANYYHGNGLDNAGLYANWLPNRLWNTDTVPAGTPEGGMFAVWNDLVDADYTELDVHGLIRDSFPVIAQKTWNAQTPTLGYSDFTSAVSSIGRGPGLGVIEQTGTAAPGEVSYQAEVTASSTDEGSDPAFLTDGRELTKWETAADTATLCIDLGEAQPVGMLQIEWAGTAPESYTVATSADGVFWQDAVVDDSGAVDLHGVTARYVAVNDIVSGGERIAAWSARVFAPSPLTEGATATASGVEASQFSPAAAVDGNPSTRWSANYVEQPWLAIDLGSSQSFGQVDILWEAAAAKAYEVQVSDDGAQWRTVATRADMPAATGKTRADTVTFEAVQARHLRILVTAKNISPYLSIFEVTVPRPAGAEAEIVASTEASPNDDGLYTAPIDVTITAGGSAGEAGAIEYRVGDREWMPLSDGVAEVSGSGDVRLAYRAQVGGIAVSGFADLAFEAVAAAPTAVVTTTPADGVGSTARPVTVTITGEGGVDGITSVEYRIDEREWRTVDAGDTVAVRGAGEHVVQARVTDGAGTVSEIVSTTVRNVPGRG